MPVIIGAAEYPESIEEKLSSLCDLTALDALALATEAGSFKAVNVVLIGVLAKSSEIPKDAWLDALKATVPAKLLEVNLKAFELGYNLK